MPNYDDDERHNPPMRDMGVLPLAAMFIRFATAFVLVRFLFILLYYAVVPIAIGLLLWLALWMYPPVHYHRNEAHHQECKTYFSLETRSGTRDPEWFRFCQDMDL